jgi:hypothetical protein
MGVSILVRDKNSYVNASKMGTASRPARNYINAPVKKNGKNDFDELVEAWNSEDEFAGVVAKYELDKGYNNKVAGTYIYPKLVHYVAEWVDLEYSITVQEIMDSINKQLHSIMEDNGLPDEPVVAKRLLDSAEVQLKVKDAEIEELKEDYERLEQEFYDLALENFQNRQEKRKVERKVERFERQQVERDVRTNFCSRRIKILRDEKKCYYLPSDDKRNYQGLELMREYLFVSGINVRLDVRTWMARQFNRRTEIVPKFTEAELPVVVTYIEDLNPKEITIHE